VKIKSMALLSLIILTLSPKYTPHAAWGAQARKASTDSSSSSSTGPLGANPTPLAVEAAVRSHLLDVFRSDESIPPLMVRLAWHDAGELRLGGR
jgi:hypothetical protein